MILRLKGGSEEPILVVSLILFTWLTAGTCPAWGLPVPPEVTITPSASDPCTFHISIQRSPLDAYRFFRDLFLKDDAVLVALEWKRTARGRRIRWNVQGWVDGVLYEFFVSSRRKGTVRLEQRTPPPLTSLRTWFPWVEALMPASWTLEGEFLERRHYVRIVTTSAVRLEKFAQQVRTHLLTTGWRIEVIAIKLSDGRWWPEEPLLREFRDVPPGAGIIEARAGRAYVIVTAVEAEDRLFVTLSLDWLPCRLDSHLNRKRAVNERVLGIRPL